MMLRHKCLRNIGQYLNNHPQFQGLIDIHANHAKRIDCHNNLLYCGSSKYQEQNRVTSKVLPGESDNCNEILSSNVHNTSDWNHAEIYTGRMKQPLKCGENLNIEYKKCPKQILNIYYDKIASEHKLQCPIFTKFTVNNTYNKFNVQCDLHVIWPEIKKFTGYGQNKKIANKNAAIACLEWLHSTNKITKDNRPIMYTAEEIDRIIKKPTQIIVEKEDIDGINAILNNYQKNVEDLTSAQDALATDNSFISEEIKPCPNMSVLNQVQRNLYLKKHLTNRLQQTDLPINKFRDKILDAIRNNSSLIIIGYTGCGKSTQVPQFIFDDFIKQGNGSNCNILVGQPRRLLASSLAKYIAHERSENIGDSIGYQIRLENITPSDSGGILYCTYGIILERLRFDPELKNISHVIMDEVHQRSMEVDILIGMLKRLQEKRPELKLILMSATLNPTTFQKYFGCPIITIPGSQYDVKMHFLDDMRDTVFKNEVVRYNKNRPEIDYNKITRIITWVSKNKPPGAILCFLPRWMDIVTVEKCIAELKDQDTYYIVKVHSKLPNSEQQNIFENFPNRRKVILATNIAESGLTVPDVVYVIDSALEKKITQSAATNLLCTELSWISKANMQQRKGRAGRVQNGESYHLINKNDYANLNEFAEPQVLNLQLNDILLKCKVLTNLKIDEFCKILPTQPDPLRVKSAVEALIRLGALDSEEQLTSLGFLMSRLPLPAVLAKATILSQIFHCADSVLSICVLFTHSNIFENTLKSKKTIRMNKTRFYDSSDHISTLRIYQEWVKSSNRSQIIDEYDLDEHNLQSIKKIIKQLNDFILDTSFYEDYVSDLPWLAYQKNKYNNEYELISGILYCATNHLIKYHNWQYNNGILRQSRHTLCAEDNLRVDVTTRSVNSNKLHRNLYFTYLYRTQPNQNTFSIINETSAITPLSVILFNRSPIIIYEETEDVTQENVTFSLECMPHFRFSCSSAVLRVLEKFRNVLWTIVDYEINIQAHNSTLNKHSVVEILQLKNELLCAFVKLLSNAAKITHETE